MMRADRKDEAHGLIQHDKQVVIQHESASSSLLPLHPRYWCTLDCCTLLQQSRLQKRTTGSYLGLKGVFQSLSREADRIPPYRTGQLEKIARGALADDRACRWCVPPVRVPQWGLRSAPSSECRDLRSIITPRRVASPAAGLTVTVVVYNSNGIQRRVDTSGRLPMLEETSGLCR